MVEANIGKFRFSVVKRGDQTGIEGHPLDRDVLKALLARVSPLPYTAPSALINKVLIEEIETPAGASRATEALQRHGIFIVRNFLDRPHALAGGRAAFAIADQARAAAAGNVRPERFDVETSGNVNYYQMANSQRAVANLRRGSDAGMVDIFNFDFISQEEGLAIRRALSSERIMSLLSTANSGRWRPTNLNAYVNQGVTETRSFHVDSYGAGQVKAFVYMTDVEDLADGPYCYVLDSHLAGPYRDMNIALSQAYGIFASTDTPIVDPEMILPVLAPAGSLIVSNQSGAHRGAPQQPGRSRAAAALNILPIFN